MGEEAALAPGSGQTSSPSGGLSSAGSWLLGITLLIWCGASLVPTRCCVPASLPRLLFTVKLQEKERNKAGQKKSLTSLQQLEEEVLSEQAGADVNKVKTIQVR